MLARFMVGILLTITIATPSLAEDSSTAQLRILLKRFPAADINGDGELTMSEAIAFRDTKAKKGKKGQHLAPHPTHENVPYGPWERNVLDLWMPKSATPTPLIVYIHGGGFIGGSKEGVRQTTNVQQALDRGVALASIQYRFRYPDDGDTSDPQRTGLQNILRDSARAIQFIRHHANRYNIDPARIACYGGSAGAGTSIWLAFHDDLADPNHADPVLRESTRIAAAGMLNGQFTYDLSQWDPAFADCGGDLIRTHGRGGKIELHKFFGMTETEYTGQFGVQTRNDVDMMGLISSEDPAIYIQTSNPDVPVTSRGIYNHHPRHATLIEQRCKECGVDVLCLLPKVRPADADTLDREPDVMMEFLFKHLGVTDL
jgi:hypothetical protein